MIEKQKQQIKEKMESIQKDIDDIPNRIKRLQENKSRWQSLLTENKISEQTFSIKFERNPVNTDVYELKQRPIYIPTEIQNQSDFMTL
jgi:peptidoglycan hydrolase CwlO-like protein